MFRLGLSKLAEYALAAGVVAAVSRESIRQILRAGGVSWQVTKTCKTSTDPDFAAKMDGTDHRTHAGQGDAIAGYLRGRNAQTQPKRHFTPRFSNPDLDGLPDQRCLTSTSSCGRR